MLEDECWEGCGDGGTRDPEVHPVYSAQDPLSWKYWQNTQSEVLCLLVKMPQNRALQGAPGWNKQTSIERVTSEKWRWNHGEFSVSLESDQSKRIMKEGNQQRYAEWGKRSKKKEETVAKSLDLHGQIQKYKGREMTPGAGQQGSLGDEVSSSKRGSLLNLAPNKEVTRDHMTFWMSSMLSQNRSKYPTRPICSTSEHHPRPAHTPAIPTCCSGAREHRTLAPFLGGWQLLPHYWIWSSWPYLGKKEMRKYCLSNTNH